MKKYALVICLSLALLGARYVTRQVSQAWKFDNAETLEQLESISGKWEIQTPAKLKQPLLTQQVKYADYPKLLVKDRDYFDFQASTRIYVSSENTDTQAGGLVLRYRNLYSFYMLFLNAKDKRITLTRAALSGFKPIKRVNHEFATDRWYELKAICYLNRIQAYVDGQLLLDAEDDTSTGGKVGLVTAGTSRVYFDGLQVNAETIEIAR
jgi:hypothetical protein